MSDAYGRSYSMLRKVSGALQLMAVTIAGTAGSITAIANTQICLPFAAIVRTAKAFIKTGGTAAGPVLLLQYSAAGTGTWTTFGSASSGTDADNTTKAFTVTATSLSAGDCIRLAIAAGTAAATPIYHVAIGFVEDFVEVS